MFKNFQKQALNAEEMLQVRGGLCACKAAAPYSCDAGGYLPPDTSPEDTIAFQNCLNDIYAGCEAADSSC